jgi:hypothetical protein
MASTPLEAAISQLSMGFSVDLKGYFGYDYDDKISGNLCVLW